MRHALRIAMTTALIAAASTALSTAASPPLPVLAAPWIGPYSGVPAFDKASPAGLAPAMEAGMARQLAELQAIAVDPAPATFENTIAAMERSGRALRRAYTVYGIYGSTLSDEAVQAVERDLEPKLAAFRDRITQNDKLFARIAAVYDTRTTAGLTAEQQRLTWLTYTDLVRAGAQLDAASKTRLAAINQSLAGLFTRFSQNLLADEGSRFTQLGSETDLEGLPESLRAGYATDAASRGLKGRWVIANTRSSVEPFLTDSTRRDLREKVWREFVGRGDNGDARDNNAIIGEILQLRAERARLLGHPTHAHWRLENTMARTPERAMELMEAVWKPAAARVPPAALASRTTKEREGGRDGRRATSLKAAAIATALSSGCEHPIEGGGVALAKNRKTQTAQRRYVRLPQARAPIGGPSAAGLEPHPQGAATAQHDVAVGVGGVSGPRARGLRLQPVLRALQRVERNGLGDDAADARAGREAVRRLRRRHRRGD